MKIFLKLMAVFWLFTLPGAGHAASPLVDVEWVKANIGKPGVAFLDVRGKLAGKSKADYLAGHIPGAVYTNYLKDGWRSKDESGVAGQLSPVPKLEKLIGGLGIDNATHVVIIPNGGTALDMGTGTRIYWTFKVLGHDKVSLLDGGMNAYLAAKDEKTKAPVNPLEKGDVKPQSALFTAKLRKEMLTTKADVKAAIASGVPLVDNRPSDQFLGINKHRLAKRLGTIPNAVNLPESWLTKNGGGSFRSTTELGNLYGAAKVSKTGKQINFCNTGHWASLGWFVSHELMGNKDAKVYDGSMLEWSADNKLTMDQKVKLN
ncbi:MAG: sulfurtransferase [Alphaproteobacteria bacterium]|nr:sulfurtransferase [Alphaproteobacteria bacterium]